MIKIFFVCASIFISLHMAHAHELSGIEELSRVSGVPENLINETIDRAEKIVDPLRTIYFTQTAIDNLSQDEQYSLLLLDVLSKRERTSIPWYRKPLFVVSSVVTIYAISAVVGAICAQKVKYP